MERNGMKNNNNKVTMRRSLGANRVEDGGCRGGKEEEEEEEEAHALDNKTCS